MCPTFINMPRIDGIEVGADAWLEKGAPLHEITQALRLDELPLPR